MTEVNRPPHEKQAPRAGLRIAVVAIAVLALLLVLLYILGWPASGPPNVDAVTTGGCPEGYDEPEDPPPINPPSEPISQSLKGYVLSSSCREGEWYFTLDLGLNAVKPCAEPAPASTEGVPSYAVKGVDALGEMLDQLPPRASVNWCDPGRARVSSSNSASSSTVGILPPAMAMTAWAVTPDQSFWFAFDEFDGIGGSPPDSLNHGLYRLEDGRLSHFDIPAIIRVLKTAPDGSLYLGAGCGVMRYGDDAWQTLLELDCGRRTAVRKLFPLDIAFAEDGLVWVGGAYSLASYDGDTWMEYDIPALRVVVAPDDSVWARGWDGRANSNCCLTHITGTQQITYTWTADVPIEPELLESLSGQPGR